MPAPATVSVRREAVTQITSERPPDPGAPPGVDGVDGKGPSAWHPVTEHGLLAALATLTST